MHWFWRATIAVGVASAFLVLYEQTGLRLRFDAFLWPLFRNGLWGGSSEGDNILRLLVPRLEWLPVYVLAVAVYGILTRRYYRDQLKSRCRKCDYLLRGISEPRCPECGEQI